MKTDNKKIYTLSEIADEFQVSRRTIYNLILPIRKELIDMYPVPKKRLGLLLPKQTKRIFEFLE